MCCSDMLKLSESTFVSKVVVLEEWFTIQKVVVVVVIVSHHNEPKLLAVLLLLTLVDHESMHLWLMVGPIHQIVVYLGLGL